jgi:hypothetical protein
LVDFLKIFSETAFPNELKFGRKHLKKSVNQKQELPEVAMFVNGSGQN